MDPIAVFGIYILVSFVSAIVIAKLCIWPWLRSMNQNDALIRLVAPHMFIRFVGLSFIVPGVVSPRLPAALPVPAAWGDFVAGLLAIIAVIGLSKRTGWAIAVAWIFNIWGAGDFLFAYVQGARVHLNPGDLGAAYFIPTAIVPPMLVTHALIFLLLARNEQRLQMPATASTIKNG